MVNLRLKEPPLQNLHYMITTLIISEDHLRLCLQVGQTDFIFSQGRTQSVW
jgi:hypothetical protein